MDNDYQILIVDDDEGTADIMSLILQNAGYKVSIDKHGALDFLNSDCYPHLILMDNKLGMKNGAELCAKLKATDQTRNIPVILISAMHDLDIIAANACADNFLSKPFNIEDLLAVVAAALSPRSVV